MSRVGKNPVIIPEGVEASITDGVFKAKGKVSEQAITLTMLGLVDVAMADGQVTVTPKELKKANRQAWGTTRALIQNAVIGASEGYEKKLEVNGVGYRASVSGSILKLALGFSHDVNHAIPEGVKVAVEGNIISVSGGSKQAVGQCAAEIRAYRPPEPYKGKGVKYVDEYILRKEGKKK